MFLSASAFAKDWLVSKDYDRTVAYLDAESYACPALYHEEHSPEEQETRRAIRESMRTIAENLVREDAGEPQLEAADPRHPLRDLCQTHWLGLHGSTVREDERIR